MKTFLITILMILLGGGCTLPGQDEGKEVRGIIYVHDMAMVYAGDNTQEIVENGCQTKLIAIGDTIELRDFQDKPVATGKVWRSVYFTKHTTPPHEDSMESYGCSFVYTIKGVPDLDRYQLMLGWRDLGEFAADDLSYTETRDGSWYSIPSVRIQGAAPLPTPTPMPTATPEPQMVQVYVSRVNDSRTTYFRQAEFNVTLDCSGTADGVTVEIHNAEGTSPFYDVLIRPDRGLPYSLVRTVRIPEKGDYYFTLAVEGEGKGACQMTWKEIR